MQITNAIFFILSLWVVYLFLNIDNKKKIFLISLLMINPILWYLTWTHPEVFCYSLIIISLTCYFNKKYKLAMLFSALASTQNPPLMILNAIYILKYFKENIKKFQYRDCMMAILSCMPIIIPNIFYMINYGKPNLIVVTGGASIKYISIKRF